MTYLQLLNRLLQLQNQGLNLDSYDVAVQVSEDEFLPATDFYVEEQNEILDKEHPVITLI